jgi:conjugal transfer/entry exclusion protein
MERTKKQVTEESYDEQYWKKKYDVMQNYYSVIIAKNVQKIESTVSKLQRLMGTINGFEEDIHKVMGELFELQQHSKDKKFKSKIDVAADSMSNMRRIADHNVSAIEDIINDFKQTL